MARQTDGVSQYLVSASALALSGSSKLTFAYWLWWDAFTATGGNSLEYGAVGGGGTGEVFAAPSDSSGQFLTAYVSDTGYTPHVDTYFNWPSSGVWHYYIVSIDRALAGAAQITNVWLDGNASPPGLATFLSGDASSTWGNYLLHLMTFDSTPVTGGYGAGRIAEVVFYSGYNFVQADADALYNAGAGRDARTVQTPTYYWPLIGTSGAFVEPGLVGGIDMVVSGATPAAHPISIWGPDVTPGPTRTMFRSRLRVY